MNKKSCSNMSYLSVSTFHCNSYPNYIMITVTRTYIVMKYLNKNKRLNSRYNYSIFKLYLFGWIKYAFWCTKPTKVCILYKTQITWGSYIEYEVWCGYLMLELRKTMKTSLQILKRRWKFPKHVLQTKLMVM